MNVNKVLSQISRIIYYSEESPSYGYARIEFSTTLRKEVVTIIKVTLPETLLSFSDINTYPEPLVIGGSRISWSSTCKKDFVPIDVENFMCRFAERT
jgi:hypothetical protein